MSNEQALENANLDRIGEISVKIREAVRLALPTPAEQFLTVMVPGKVVNLEDYQIDEVNHAILPLKTELSQAILCDDMPCLSTLQMGPTGKSVSRSYANAISKLVSAETTIGIDANSMSDEQKRYEQGMKILSSELPDKPGLSLVELYTEKQAAYTKAVENKTKAFDDALKRAKDDPMNRSTAQVREAYDKWVDENARTYRNYVQAAYMDWVITGRKEEVEYWFSVVDQDSALARIEQSKEVMRWAVVQDVDGSTEYQKVKLEPSDWANKCLDKIKLGTNQTKTADWYTWEITRLEKTNAMLELLRDSPPKLEVDSQAGEELDGKIATAETTLKETMTTHIQKHQAYQKALGANDKAGADTALDEYKAAQKALDDAQKDYEQLKLARLSLDNKNAQNTLLQSISDGFAGTKIAENDDLINRYKEELAKLPANSDSQGTVDEVAEDLGIPKPIPDPTRPLPTTDFFTPITVEVTASSEKKRSESSATSFSAGGSASWGLLSVSASVSHSEAHSKASSELANSDVKVSFECMRVDITRPWLRPELFYDDDLVPGPGVKISPGFGRLRQLMESPNPTADMEAELAMYSTFPLYPVAFLVACNVVLEISGSTTSLQSYMNSSSTSASLSVGYGPFSVSGSGAHSSSDAGSTCESTASGCRIEIKSPQIIAWVSQMVPALPRLSSANSKDLVRDRVIDNQQDLFWSRHVTMVVRLSNLNFAEQWSNDPALRPGADLRFTEQESAEPRRIDTHLTFSSFAESQSTTPPLNTAPASDEADKQRQLPKFKSGEAFRDHFSHDKPGEELSHDAMVWRLYRAEAEEYDQELVTGRRASLDVLLLFAALFSAILTAFLVESKDLLQQDPAHTTATLLLIIAQNQINSNTNPPTPIELPDFTPTKSALWINGLWFASLSLSLATALVAMLSKEWLTAYTSSRQRPAHTHSLLRQARFDGLNSWSALHIIAFLPTLLHVSLLLFAVGLVIYLWTLDVAVAAVTCAVVALTVVFYLGTTLLGAVIPFCPFVTEMSRYLQQTLTSQLGNWFKRHLQPYSIFSEPRRETTSLEDIRAVCWLAENTRDPVVIDCSYQALAGIRVPPEASDKANDAVKQWYKSLDRIFPAALARFVAALQDRRGLASSRGANLARHTRTLVQLCEFLDTVDQSQLSRSETSRVAKAATETRRGGRPRLESFALPSFSDSPPLPPSRQRAELALEALDGAWRDDLPPFSADTFACLTAAELRLVALTASSLRQDQTPDTDQKEASTPDSNPEATIINFAEPPRAQLSLATLQTTYYRSLVRGSIQLRYHVDGRTPISSFALITLLDAFRTAAACTTLNSETQSGSNNNAKKDADLAFLVPVFSFDHYIRLTDLPRGPLGAIIRVLGMSVLHPHGTRTISSAYKHTGFQIRLSAARAIAVLAPVLLKQWMLLRVPRSGDSVTPPEAVIEPDLQSWPIIGSTSDAARLENTIMIQLLTIIQTIGPHIERAGALSLAESSLAEMNRISKLAPYSAFLAIRRHIAQSLVPLLEYAIKDRRFKGNETHVPLSDTAKTHLLHLLTFEISGKTNTRRHHLPAQFIPVLLRVTQGLPDELPLVRTVLKYVVDRVRDTRNSLEYLQIFTRSDQGYPALVSIGRVHESYIELVVGAILQITHVSISGGAGSRHENAVMSTSAIHGFLDAIHLVARHTAQVANKQGHRHLHSFGRNIAYVLHRVEPEAARIVLEHGALDEVIGALQIQYDRSQSDLSLHKGKAKSGKGDGASSEHLLGQLRTLKNERLRELASQVVDSREEERGEGSGTHSVGSHMWI